VTEKTIQDTIRKKYGETAIRKLTEVRRVHVDVIPTGSLSLDYSIGVGGIPRGRATILVGWEGSAKTSIALHTTANAQKQNLNVLYIDVENALDPEYAKALGVDIDALELSQPDSAEEALNILDAVAHTTEYGLIVIDSIAALVPQAEIESDFGSSHMGLQARLLAQLSRKLPSPIKENNIAVIMINQGRANSHTGYAAPGAPKEVQAGGNAIRFMSSLTIKLTAGAILKSGDDIIGRTIYARIEKNKVGLPFRNTKFDLIFGKGISRGYELVDLGVQTGIISKKGAFYSFGDTRIGQGRDNARQFLEENTEIAQTVETAVRESFKTTTLPDVSSVNSDDTEEETEL
jgi:recombination protein RecA